jgi:predicted dehydrogenase
MLKVAIVGCGKIADSHAAQIQQIPECKIVAASDQEPLMAKQLCERFPVKKDFVDLVEMLEQAAPDVVHITTPPDSHFRLATQCLEAGCHVYVEKPFTLCESDARTLIDLAVAKGVKITAGHDDQFSPVARRMRALIQTGYLGGPPVHMESYYGYELAGSAYANALLEDKQHWVRRLPGKLLQNIISHGVARIAEHLRTDSPCVHVTGFISPRLREMGETEIIDELRVVLTEEDGASAYFTFSSQMRPSLHLFRIYGPANGLILDQDQETMIRLRGKHRKSYLETFVSPLALSRQYFGETVTNVKQFLAKDFHMKSGMRYLIESFYRSILHETSPPIPAREILLTTRIMDSIFAGLGEQALRSSPRNYPVAKDRSASVTGRLPLGRTSGEVAVG